MKSRREVLAIAGAAVVGLAAGACSTNTSSGGGGSGGGSSPGTSSSGGGSGSGSGKTVNVYVSKQSSYPTEQQQWFARISQAFKKKTGADVKFEIYSSGSEELQKIQTSVISGTGPDVYEIGTTFTPTAYSTGAFLQFDDARWSKIGGRDRFVAATLAMSGPDPQHQIGVPSSSVPFLMYYNTKMFKAAGISAAPTTWDELIADAKKLTKGNVHGLGMDYKDNYSPWKYAWMFSNQYGDPLIDGSKVTIDDPAVKKAYQAYFGFLTKDKIVPPEAVNWSGAENLAAFAAGKTAMMTMATTGSLPTLITSPIKDDFALAPMPEVPPGAPSAPSGTIPATSIVSGQNIVVASYSANQDLAVQYVDLVTSKEEQMNYSKVFGVLPTNSAAATAIADANDKYAPALAAGKKSRPTPFTGAWSQVQLGLVDVVVQSLAALSAGNVPDSALAARLSKLQAEAQAAVTKASQQK